MSLKWRFIIAPLLGLVFILVLIYGYYQQENQLSQEFEDIVYYDLHSSQVFSSIASQAAINHAKIFSLLRYAEQEIDEGLVYDKGKNLLLTIHKLEALVESDSVNNILISQSFVDAQSFIDTFKTYKYGASNSIVLATVDLTLAKSKMLEMTTIFNKLNIDIITLVTSIGDKIRADLKTYSNKRHALTEKFFLSLTITLLIVTLVSILLSSIVSKKLNKAIALLHSLTVREYAEVSHLPPNKSEIIVLNEVIHQVKINHNKLVTSEHELKDHQFHLEEIIRERTKKLEDSSQALREAMFRAEDRARQIESKNIEIGNAFSQLQQAQAVLIETEKNAALGRLVAGVAHEVNTPLGITVTAISHAGELTEKINDAFKGKRLTATAMRQYLTEVQESIAMADFNIQRAADTIQNFKEIAADQTSFNYHEIELKTYIDQIIQSVMPEFKSRPIQIENLCRLEIKLFTLPGAIAQVLTNLLMNSLLHAYSVEQSGIIKISTLHLKGRVLLTYQDDGKGMSEETQLKMYEPFYTTNRSGGGTGLGMHIVFNLINNALQGSIICHSKLGKGVQFEIDIPLELSDIDNNIV